jgi:hypothetical protein
MENTVAVIPDEVNVVSSFLQLADKTSRAMFNRV